MDVQTSAVQEEAANLLQDFIWSITKTQQKPSKTKTNPMRNPARKTFVLIRDRMRILLCNYWRRLRT